MTNGMEAPSQELFELLIPALKNVFSRNYLHFEQAKVPLSIIDKLLGDEQWTQPILSNISLELIIFVEKYENESWGRELISVFVN